MRSPTEPSRSIGRKLLIPGLLLLLLAVLLLPSKPKAAEGNSQPAPVNVAPVVLPHYTGALKAEVTSLSPSSPEFVLSDAMVLDPFQPPKPTDTTAQSATTTSPTLQSQPQSVQENPSEEPTPSARPIMNLQAIFYDRRGAAAIIEDRIWRTGDALPDGRQILRITNAGVELGP